MILVMAKTPGATDGPGKMYTSRNQHTPSVSFLHVPSLPQVTHTAAVQTVHPWAA